MLTITDNLHNLQAWMHIHAPKVTFRGPASQVALDNFQEKSGLVVPDDLQQMLLVADGENNSSAGAIGGWRFLSIAEIQAVWGWLKQMSEKDVFEDQQPKHSPYMRRVWWHPAWIPILSNDQWDYFCIDTDPPEPSRQGQILLFLHDQPERYLIASSLSAWLDRILKDLESGTYHFDRELGFNNEAFMWSALEGKHHFDKNKGIQVVRN